MMKKTSIKQNLFYQAIYEILILILPLFTSPYISRVLGAEKLGIFSYTYSVACFFQVFGLMGIRFYGNRCIASTRDNEDSLNKTFSELLIIHFITGILAFVVYILYATFFSPYREYAFMQSLIVLSTVIDISWLFFGLELFKSTVTRNLIVKLLSVILIFTFVKNSDDLILYTAIMAGSQLLSQGILFFMARKYVKFTCPKIADLKPHFKPLFMLFIPAIALSLFEYMDKLMLGTFGTTTELGFYENAKKIVNIPLSIIYAFGSVMLPKMTNMIANHQKSSVERYMELSIKYMVALAIAMAFGVAGIAQIFAPVFWGNEFKSSIILMQLLSITLPFSTLATIIRNQDMIPRGKDKYYSYAILAGAVLNLIINYFLIPRYQAVGASIGTIVAEICVFLVEWLFVRKQHNYLFYISKSLYFLIPGIVMYCYLIFIGEVLGNHIYTLVVQVGGGVCIFVGIALLLAYIIRDKDITSMISSIRKRHS